MKTKFFLLGMAVAAFASCTNEEVTEIAQNRAIRFNQFVENNTKAAQEVNSVTNFYVFGELGDSEGNYGMKIFNNELQSTPYYWVSGKYYSFGAYSDGTGNAKIANAAFTANEGKLTFDKYEANDDKDLVAAVAKMNCSEASTQGKVSLTFKHMLSQVKFTFKTTDGDSYTIKISALKLHAPKSGKGTYTATDGAKWESTYNQTDTYVYSDIADVAMAANKYEAASDSKLVIPQASTDQLKVTFTAEITGGGLEKKSADFEATLGVNANIAGNSSTENTWVPGYKYNYTAEINGEKIAGDGQVHKITFTPTVSAWENATEQGTTPQVKQ